MSGEFVRQSTGAGEFLVGASYAEAFREAWFDPDFWGADAAKVSHSGRGAAWFIHRAAGDLVLRHFFRGGLPGRILTRDYIYTGADAVRSFSEFRLLVELLDRGLPVPEPVAAGYWRRNPLLYHASILFRRIPEAISLAALSSPADMPVWREAGACIRRFHDAGVFHADLNCTNILVADQVYLIDFDRGKLMGERAEASWKTANMSRLKRSVEKCLGGLGTGNRDQLWQALMAGYQRG